MKSCTKKGCRKTRFIKPEFSSVFTHKILPSGRVVKLPKPTYAVENPDTKMPQGDWPLDYQNYKLVRKPTSTGEES